MTVIDFLGESILVQQVCYTDNIITAVHNAVKSLVLLYFSFNNLKLKQQN